MKTSNILIAVVVMVGAILAIFWHHYFKRQADWDEVQKTAIRVDSGLRHETLIALRSKVADLDAALTYYVDRGSGRQKEHRVLSIQQAIESLEWAIDHKSSTSTILDGTADFSFYEKHPYLIAEPDCAKLVGKLYLDGAAIAGASLTYAEDALAKPDESPRLRTLDLRSLRTKCVSDYEAYTRQQSAAAAARRRQVQNSLLQVGQKCLNIESEGDVGTSDAEYYAKNCH
jgi:hypothetical protein